MKKLITLLLVLTGMVSTASATKTIYIRNNCGWTQMRCYQWGTGDASQWMFIGSTDYVTTYMVDDTKYWKVTLNDDTKTSFIIDKNHNDAPEKTNDLLISSVTDGHCYELEWTHDYGKIKYYNLKDNGELYSYTFSVSNVDEISWTNIYLWNDKGAFVTWPGDTFNGSSYELHTFTDRGDVINVIFNQGNGEGKKQTEDLTAVRGSNTYLIKEIGSKYKRVERATPNASGYCTFVNTNPLIIPEETAYYATDNGNGSATAKQITNPEASTPMLIKGTPSTPLYFEVAATGESATGNAFHAGPVTGLESNPSTGIYNYILNGDTFYAANGKNVGENKAYLQLSKSAPAGARVLKFDGDDETTGINTVENGQPVTENTAVYNLNGQRIMKPTKGLYIQNGKKYIVK